MKNSTMKVKHIGWHIELTEDVVTRGDYYRRKGRIHFITTHGTVSRSSFTAVFSILHRAAVN